MAVILVDAADSTRPPLLLVMGQVVADEQPDGTLVPGGAAFYAAHAAARLGGWRVRAVTRPHTHIDVQEALSGVECHLTGPPATTKFSHQPTAAGRVSRWAGRTRCIALEDIPVEWRTPTAVLLAPVCQEVDLSLITAFPTALTCAAAQGWVRRRDAAGLVHTGPWRGLQTLLRMKGVVLISEEDLGQDLETGMGRLERFPVAVMTRGARGALLWSKGRWQRVFPFAAAAVDETGAGDVFAAAFICALAEHGGPLRAAQFASAAASLAIEGRDIAALPGRPAVEERLRSDAHGPTPADAGETVER